MDSHGGVLIPVLLVVSRPVVLSFNPSALGPRAGKPQSSAPIGSRMQENLGAVYDPTPEEFGALLEFALGMQENLKEEQSWDGTGANFSAIRTNSYVGPSSRYGTRHELGLFASTDLEKDTIATFYPCHALGNERQVFTMDRAYNSSGIYRKSVMQPTIRGAWFDIELDRPDLQGWLGHRANDAACLNGSSETAILNYIETSVSECNCILVPFGDVAPLAALVTTRPVSKDEELLHSYGFPYWLERHGFPFGSQIGNQTVFDILAKHDYIWMNRIPSILARYGDEVDLCNMILRDKYKWPPTRTADGAIELAQLAPESDSLPSRNDPAWVPAQETEEETMRSIVKELRAARGGKKRKKVPKKKGSRYRR